MSWWASVVLGDLPTRSQRKSSPAWAPACETRSNMASSGTPANLADICSRKSLPLAGRVESRKKGKYVTSTLPPFHWARAASRLALPIRHQGHEKSAIMVTDIGATPVLGSVIPVIVSLLHEIAVTYEVT